MCARLTYNLFTKVRDAAQLCAVRQDQPIPGFIDGAAWDYVGSVQLEREVPPGFDAEAAERATRLVGFHLYSRPVLAARDDALLCAA
ncbi:hypothetical protein Q8W71_02460 [Methylobacterium sp. NEAU 140]|uniref:hypothetical protein n=1 Tax=Methylobacterium sp. NEAU 140 TaxID=3064945 RepID=UPI0027348F16|nr:hypothetical protein [Methylobacterium sp. NEAU 140]MDP4021472.1 hypothetical protein [Methylobacterium sp. NEAU 140]